MHEIKTLFERENLEILGVTRAEPLTVEEEQFCNWIAAGYHGTMEYLKRHAGKKFRPAEILPGCSTLIFTGLNYFQPRTKVPPGHGAIARYAWGRDYHKVLGKRLKRLAASLREIFQDERFFSFVDTTPLAEGPFAAHAGVGFIGRNTLLIRRGFGSWFVIGGIATTLELDPSLPEPARGTSGLRNGGAHDGGLRNNGQRDGELQEGGPDSGSRQDIGRRHVCSRAGGTQNDGLRDGGTQNDGLRADGSQDGTQGSGWRADGTQNDGTQGSGRQDGGWRDGGSQNACPPGCSRCIDACPTGALFAPYRIDARKCISYLTIEHRGCLDEKQALSIGDRIFGCDACQEACPFNHGVETTYVADFLSPRAGQSLSLQSVLSIKNNAEFSERFAGSPLMRAKRSGLVRNACVCAVNLGLTNLLPDLKGLADDPDQVVAKQAVWAAGKLQII